MPFVEEVPSTAPDVLSIRVHTNVGATASVVAVYWRPVAPAQAETGPVIEHDEARFEAVPAGGKVFDFASKKFSVLKCREGGRCAKDSEKQRTKMI